jgi:hypothetical protein
MTVAATTSSDARAAIRTTVPAWISSHQDRTSLLPGIRAILLSIRSAVLPWLPPHVTGVVALYLQGHTGASPATITSVLKSYATNNVVTSPGTGSPNKMLFLACKRRVLHSACDGGTQRERPLIRPHCTDGPGITCHEVSIARLQRHHTGQECDYGQHCLQRLLLLLQSTHSIEHR